MSVSSQDVVERHDNYQVAFAVKDANLLWLIIVDTHVTNPSGGGANNLKAYDRNQKQFDKLSQKDLPIPDFYKLYVE